MSFEIFRAATPPSQRPSGLAKRISRRPFPENIVKEGKTPQVWRKLSGVNSTAADESACSHVQPSSKGEEAMKHVVPEVEKQRLVERADIIRAIKILKLRGIDSDQVTLEITRLFYVDLDTYNEVLERA